MRPASASSRPIPTRALPELVPAVGPGGEPHGPPAREPVIEIVVPVYNEEGALEESILRLHDFLSREMPRCGAWVFARRAASARKLRPAIR